MDKKPAAGHRIMLNRRAVTTAQIMIVGATDRHAVVVYNEGPGTIYLGDSGQATSFWMALEAGNGFVDNYTIDPWYAVTLAGSGTISGFIVV